MTRLKLWITSLALLIMTMPVLPAYIFASGDPTYSLTLSTPSVEMNRELTVTVQGQNAVDLYGYEVVLQFDNQKLSYKEASTGTSGFSVKPELSGNSIRLAQSKVGQIAGDNGNVNLASVTFNTVAVGAAEIKLSKVIAVSSQTKETFWSESAAASVNITSPQHSSSKSSGGGGSGGTASPSQPTVGASQSGALITVKETTKSKTDTGKELTVASISKDSLSEAIKQLQTNTSSTNNITVEMSNQGSAVKVELPASSLAEIATLPKDTVIVVKSDAVTYYLPVKVVDISKAAQALGADAKDVTISIVIEKVSGTDAQKVADTAGQSGLRLLTGAVDFSITAQGNGKTVSINEFKGAYLPRNIEVPAGTDPTKATGVLYNPETGEMTFVPTLFQTVDGKTIATIQRQGNSIYAIVESNKSFNDLNGHWAKEDVQILVSKLLVNGRTETTFVPQGDITRAEFATLLVKGLGLTEDKSSKFKDVSASDWYAGFVGAASKAGLVDGLSADTFAPNANITREQMAALISRAINLVGKQKAVDAKKVDVFKDQAAISAWAKESIAQTIDAKIMNGKSADMFDPSANSTRAESAVVLKRLLQYISFIN
ncbi:S-layer homology domain-containing protein [Paenibacillus radicis (ex Xue et al. 2023)]|uniref:S-layer homology domain-containing protein n=1 Tax=Paenibacillus radicis (ex Xue et al. 2023) TaxID=2972489 RepID=A0ABT1YRA1_9BACL|nr:S-layer homology domain-containing protein [Paenibacillus radicis (ex Xue et al. 2023)]MCR8635711.1 S-layer homology domain-containing protein [Paenibacillus radicis (ex Xue et al. 2023)]